MTRAVILAAGQGTRLCPLTDDKPKCLVELAGKSLLSRQIEVLDAAGISGTARAESDGSTYYFMHEHLRSAALKQVCG